MTPLIRPLRAYPRLYVGIVAAAIGAALLLGTLAVGTLRITDKSYTAEFAHSGGAGIGNDVRIAGISVGQVTGARLAGDRVVVSFRVRPDVQLGRATRAAIKVSTLLGGRYLELQPSGDGEPPDDTIPLAQTTVPFDLQNVISAAAPAVEQLDKRKIGDSLRALVSSARGAPEATGAALDGINRLGSQFDARRGQLGRMLGDTQRLMQMVSENQAGLFRLLGQGNEVLQEVLRKRDLLRSLLRDGLALLDQGQGILHENRPNLEPLLQRLSGIAAALERNTETLDRVGQLLPPATRYGANASGNGPYIDGYLPYFIMPDNLLCAMGTVKGCK